MTEADSQVATLARLRARQTVQQISENARETEGVTGRER